MTSHSQGRAVLAWSLWLIAFGCCAGGLALALALTRPLTLGVLAQGAVFALTFVIGFATVGLVMTLRLPANPIGWLYAAAGLTSAWNTPLGPWIDRLVSSGQPLPVAARFAMVLGEFTWAPAITLGVTLPALLLPNGRLRSRRWRVVVATSVTGSVLAVVAGSLVPGQLDNGPAAGRIDNPFGLAGPAGRVAGVVVIVGVLLHWASLPAAGVCVLLRFRASRGVERQQMRWVAAGMAGAVVGLLVSAVGGLELLPSDLANSVVSSIVLVALLCPPMAIAVAVLRYRLWDLDRLVSRTVTYTLVTGLVVVPFLLVLPVATRLVGRAGSLAVAAATLAAAAAFQPLRRRVQDRVDRRFNRRRYDAAQTIRGFSGRLRQQIDLDRLTGELVTVVDQTMQPTQVAVWLRATPGPATSATRSPRP